MSAGRYDFVIEQGTYFELPLTWRDENNNLINLTGYTAALKANTSTGTVISLATGSGITLGGALGTILITIPDETTETYDFDIAKYNLELYPGNGKVVRLLKGYITLDREEIP